MPENPPRQPVHSTPRSCPAAILLGCVLTALPVHASIDYLQEFSGSGNTTYDTFSWSAYLTKDDGSVVDWSNSTSPPAYIAPGNYAFFAPRIVSDFDNADGPGLLFTTDAGPCNLGDLTSLSLDENMDATSGDPARGRFTIQIGAQWYASELEFTSTTENGASGAFSAVALSGINFTDGANWRELTVALGGSGEITLAGSPVGGTLSGLVTAFGVYAEPGNDGDHFRIDNFAMSADPTVATEIYLEEFPTPGGGDQNMASVGWSALVTESGQIVSYSQTGVGSAVGVANNGYGFYAPKNDADVDNDPGLVTTSEVNPVDISTLTSVTWDTSADNTDDGSRVAIEVGGVWYASEPALNDGQTDSGAGSFVPLGFSPTSFATASNWRIINNTVPGDANPLSLGAAPGSDLSGTVTGFGLYLRSGTNNEAGGDHIRFDNFRVFARVSVVAVADAIEVGVGGGIAFDPTANDQGLVDASSMVVVSGPSDGTVTLDPTGERFIYKHSGATAGNDSFRYQISELGGSTTSEADVTVNISGAVRLEDHTVEVPLDPPVPSSGVLAMEVGLPGLTFPDAIAMTSVPGTPEALLVASLNGSVWYIPDTTESSPSMHKVLEITSALSDSTNNRAILSLTCYPDFATTGHLILNYQGDKSRLPPVGNIPNLDKNGSPNTTVQNELRVSRFTLSPAHIADAIANGMSSAENTTALATEYPFINMAEQNQIHSINDCKFGPDGYLYISFGDEGGQPDPHYNGQTITKDYFSSILRIDVDPASTNPKPNPHYTIPAGPLSGGTFPAYTDASTQDPNFRIPADNPFIHSSLGGTWDGNMNGTDYSGQLTSVRTEIWVLGLRNPFKFHLDTDDGTPTGEVEAWIGDIGYNDREEIDLFTSGDNGGWSYFEGELTPAFGNGSAPGGSTPHKPALWTYNTGSSTGNSVIGGVFYRDTSLPSLTDTYVFGDYGSGRIFSLTRAGDSTELTTLQLGGADIIDFELDQANGDIFVLEYGPSGRVMRITDQAGGPSDYPDKLSKTGIFADLADLTPNPGVVAYTPNLKFWSDDADKSRWFVIKNLSDTISYSQDGNWSFPEGMIWVKHFDFDLDQQNPGTNVKRLETRLLVRNASGSYGVAYRWNEAGTDADLVVTSGESFPINFTDDTGVSQNFTWQIPSRAECTTCHTSNGGHALSMNSRQFNLDQIINGQTGNLMELMHTGGYLTGFPGSAAGLPRHYRPDETTVDLEERVRSYLAVNCAYCHMDGGSAPPSFDARAHLTLEQTNLLYGEPISEGTPDDTDHIIRPGDKPNSSIWNKVNARAAINGSFNGYSQMPPLGTNRFDSAGIDLLEEWITNHANVAPASADGSLGETTPVSENASAGAILGLANADDPDVRGGIQDQNQLSYTIVSGNEHGLFSIDTLTGELQLNGWIDYERDPQHVLTVEVSDNFSPNPGVLTRTLVIDLIDESSPDLTEDLNGNGIFDAWESLFGVASLDEDDDKDGIPAFFEFLTGGDPNTPDSPLDLDLGPSGPAAPDHVDLSWNVRNGFILDLDYLVNQSGNLSSWSPLANTVDYEVISVTPVTTGISRIVIRVPENGSSSFLNLSSPPPAP